ncbi:MAG TPA: eight-cysteine-cluster domain-containing protein [Myxococcota bacterium]|nr:eight-cysteine-cluster domain-containing protein [Myxococcota bacterium]
MGVFAEVKRVFMMLFACWCEAPEPPVVPLEKASPFGEEGLQPMTELIIEDGYELYQDCRERVEWMETAGECAVDSDCLRGGCSREVCAPAATIAEVMTTCEIRLCFHALKSCGCVDGVCQWSLHPDGTEVPVWPFTGAPTPPDEEPRPADPQ